MGTKREEGGPTHSGAGTTLAQAWPSTYETQTVSAQEESDNQITTSEKDTLPSNTEVPED